MRRLWIRCVALIAIGVCGCQNTSEKQPQVLSSLPATPLQGVVSAPLAIPLAAAALVTRTLSSGYKPAAGVSVQVILMDSNGVMIAHLSATTGPDGSYRVMAPFNAADIFNKSTIAVLVNLGGGVQLGLLSPLTEAGGTQADVNPGTTVLAFAELGVLAVSDDPKGAYTAFFQSSDVALARMLGQANSGNANLLVQVRSVADILAGLAVLRNAADGAGLSAAEAGAATTLRLGLGSLLSGAAARGAQVNPALIRAALAELLKQLTSALAGLQPKDLAGLLVAFNQANQAALHNLVQVLADSGQPVPSPTPFPTPSLPPLPSASSVSGVSGVAGGSGSSQAAGGGI